jgi:hypothetical protein
VDENARTPRFVLFHYIELITFLLPLWKRPLAGYLTSVPCGKIRQLKPARLQNVSR